MSTIDQDENPVEALASQFVERRRRGEDPAIEEYAACHPELAGSILELFPTIEALEKIRARHQQSDGPRLPRGTPKLRQLGDFRIVRQVGRGGMGIVYEAVQESLQRRVAVKVLARHSQLDDTHRHRFLREARTAGRLHHTNIVPILGVGEQDGLDYYVMQFIDGIGLDAVILRLHGTKVEDRGSLRLSSFWQPGEGTIQASSPTRIMPDTEHVQIATRDADTWVEGTGNGFPLSRLSAPLSDIGGSQPLRHLCRTYWHDVAYVGLQVAQALEYAHSQRTLHRDIKPANLLVDAEGTIWVADFGLAKGIEHEGVSRTGEILGTLLYMAPEQWRGATDERSDIYSLGVTLYELLTLRHPCDIHDRIKSLGQSTVHSAVTAPRKHCPAIPVDLETVVMKAMAEEPQARYQTAGALAADLAQFLEDRPISVRRPTLAERWSRWRRRNPAAAALSAVAAALLVMVAVVASVGYVRTSAALSRESEERQRSETTLAMSLDTLENVFARLVPDRLGETRALALTGEERGGLSAGAQPMVSPETASLLEDLLRVYDRLTEVEGTKSRLGVESARAIRRIGDIHARLGNVDRAEAAYRQAIDRYQAMSADDPDGRIRLELARLHNDLGAVKSQGATLSEARDEHRQALAILAGATAPARPRPDERFELARSHYLLGRGRDRQSNPGAPEGGKPDGPPGRGHGPPGHHPPGPHGHGPPDFGPGEFGRTDFGRERQGPPGGGPPDGPFGHGPPPRRRPGRRPDPNYEHGPPEERGGPGSKEWESDPAEMAQAVALLEPLTKEDPANPAYRYLLAQCYREGPVRGPLPDVEKAETLLAELVKQHPGVADYRFELADTYAMLDVRDLPPDDYPEAEKRLRAALAQSTALVEGHPYAPDYAVLQIHILHKLARILREIPPDDESVDEQTRIEEAAQMYQESLRRQAALVARFPDNAVHRMWLTRICMSYSQLQMERHQAREAHELLKMTLADVEAYVKTHPQAASLASLMPEVKDFLSEAAERMQHEKDQPKPPGKGSPFGPPPPGGDGHPPPRRD